MSGYIGDGLPDSGRWTRAPDGNVQTGPSDDAMLESSSTRGRFTTKSSRQLPGFRSMRTWISSKSRLRVRAIYRLSRSRWIQTHKRRWPAQWARPYAAEARRSGSRTARLSGCCFRVIHRLSRCCRGSASLTVQHLAKMRVRPPIDAIGMHGRQDYVNGMRRNHLNAGAGGAAFHQMQRDLEEYPTRENGRLKKDVDDLRHQMQQINQTMMANAGIREPRCRVFRAILHPLQLNQ